MKKIIVTIGPTTRSEEVFRKICSTDTSFVRVNMSHAGLEELERTIVLAKKYDIPFILDTEGSQIRTGNLSQESVFIEQGTIVKLWNKEVVGDQNNINFKPHNVVEKLKRGDLVFLDFNSLMLRIDNLDTLTKEGFITAKVVTSGSLGRNKSAVINQTEKSDFSLSILSEKDISAIDLALQHGVEYIAASFVHNAQEVEYVRERTKGRMQIISKIETSDALKNLDSIITKSDAILIDRGDLSKEIPLEKIPLIQKLVLKKANELNTPAFIATNLLESMIFNSKPTRAELNDVMTSLLDGASGLALCAETAIGKYPIEAINTLSKMINEASSLDEFVGKSFCNNAYEKLITDNYLNDDYNFSLLIKPHGGKLINKIIETNEKYVNSLKKIKIDSSKQMDLEQIAVGGYSPLKGFMNKADFDSVLDNMTLSDKKTVWTIPIVLDIDKKTADEINVGETIALEGDSGIVGLIKVEDIYVYDKKETQVKWFGTDDIHHPGVLMVEKMENTFIGGEIHLLKRSENKLKEHELTPMQTRRIFDERGWRNIVGFHTRNVPHRGHEHVQLDALQKYDCDGLFIQPVTGKKKTGDFLSEIIVETYEKLINTFYPKEKVLFGVLATYPRYSGPREAVFTAICRKNYGCNHFIVGRDHTGVGNYYQNLASHDIFEKIPDIGIKIIKYSDVAYYPESNTHSSEDISGSHKKDISATVIRDMIKNKQLPPDWLIRSEISEIILEKETVFVEEESNSKVIWFTGLSGAGKTSIAEFLQTKLREAGYTVKIIDGDDVREKTKSKNKFTKDEIRENNTLIANLCTDYLKAYDYILVPVISPYSEIREEVKNIIGEEQFTLLYISTSLNTCMERDVKGLYKKSLEGSITNMIGLHDEYPYEEPENMDISVSTEGKSIEAVANEIISLLLFDLKDRNVISEVLS